MKKVLYLILYVVLIMSILSVWGCSAKNEGIDPETSNGNEQLTEYTVELSEETERSLQEELEEFKGLHANIRTEDGYEVYELPFERDGLNIYGQLFIPESFDEKTPLVIIGHGLGSGYSDCVYEAEYFAASGIAAYIFDFCGGSTYTSSDGDFMDMSVLTEIEDMRAVFDSLKTYAFLNQNKVFLMGESQGGLVAALLAAENRDEVSGLVLYYPAFSIPDNARAMFGTKSQIPYDLDEQGYYLGYKYYYDVIDIDPYETINNFEGPVLIIHGDEDEIVPLSYSERAAETYSDAQLIVIQGAGHGFSGDAAYEAAGYAAEFILK